MGRMWTRLASLYRSRPGSCSLAAAAGVLALDYFSGRVIQFPLLYIVPTAMAAWRNRKPEAYLLALGLPAARVAFHVPWHETGSLDTAIVNALIRTCVLACFAYLVDRVSMQTQALRARVGLLEGVLPICAACKRIRNDDGVYEPIEAYISERSRAMFSHGICDDCGRQLYPDLWGRDSP